MTQLSKRPIVIQDLIDISTYISTDNLDAGDRFIYAAEATFQLIAKIPGIGRFSGFTNPEVQQVRQYPVKGFPNYLILYLLIGYFAFVTPFLPNPFHTQHETWHDFTTIDCQRQVFDQRARRF